MTDKKITCITCPLGCDIIVRGENDVISHMEGSRCKRGEEYARSEFLHPERILTTTVKLEGAGTPLLPVRSDGYIPKELLMQCMQEIRKVCAKHPVSAYTVIITDILGTGANIVATGESK